MIATRMEAKANSSVTERPKRLYPAASYMTLASGLQSMGK